MTGCTGSSESKTAPILCISGLKEGAERATLQQRFGVPPSGGRGCRLKPGTCLASRSPCGPVGTGGNSPAFQRWERRMPPESSPVGTADARAPNRITFDRVIDVWAKHIRSRDSERFFFAASRLCANLARQMRAGAQKSIGSARFLERGPPDAKGFTG